MQYVPKVQYQHERAAILYTVYATAQAAMGKGTPPVWEELDDAERSSWFLVAVEPLDAKVAEFIA